MVERIQLSGDVPETAEAPTSSAGVQVYQMDENEASASPAQQENPAPAPAPEAAPAIPQPLRDPSLPGRFQDVRALAEAYEAAQRKITELARVAQPAPTGEQPALAPQPAPAPQPQAQQAIPLAQTEIDRYTQEFSVSGRLSEESFRELETRGIPRGIANNYIEGQMARGQQILARAQEIVGGAKEWEEMSNWAGSGLTYQEQMAFNAQVMHPDQAVREFAISGLKARFDANRGPNLVKGTGRGGSGVQPFRSEAEQTAAINDKKYTEDAGYRAEVERRIIAGGR